MNVSKSNNRPFVLYLITVCLVFLSLGGFFGAFSFISDPSGHGMGMSIDALKPLQLNDYLLPGLFLLSAYAIGSLVVLFSLWARLRWSWLALIALNLVLLGWLAGEVVILNLIAPISIVLAILAVAMLVLAFIPSTRRFCKPQ